MTILVIFIIYVALDVLAMCVWFNSCPDEESPVAIANASVPDGGATWLLRSLNMKAGACISRSIMYWGYITILG